MDTCQFSYIGRVTRKIFTALGVEQCWADLKREFSLSVAPIQGVRYYKTISFKGPQLFAVDKNNCVWYYDEDKWLRYETACDVKYGVINEFNPKRAQNEIEDQMYFDKISEPVQEQYGINDEF